MAIVALAGPVSNLLMACIWALIIIFINALLSQSSSHTFLYEMASKGIIINVVLMVLNLIPIPPLDGSRVVAGILPQSLLSPYMKLERFGMMIVLVLLISGILGKIMWPMVIYFVNLIGFIFGI
jgi:Zn-dependent protease